MGARLGLIAAIVMLGCGASEPRADATVTSRPASITSRSTGRAASAAGGQSGGAPRSGAPRPLPPRIDASIQLPGSDASRFVTATIEMSGLPWTMDGCVSTVRGSCRRTRRTELDEATRTELVRAWQEVAVMPRCEPSGVFPGDREYTLTTAAATYRGMLPAEVARLATRNAGECRADARLAWWIAERMTRTEGGTAAVSGTGLSAVGSGDRQGVIFTGTRARELVDAHGLTADATWDPDAAMIDAMEAALPAWIRTGGGTYSGPRIAGRWTTYRRQYAGIVRAGHRVIFGSYFCGREDDSQWRSAPISVDDGGDCYFVVTYDPATRTFADLVVNGEG